MSLGISRRAFVVLFLLQLALRVWLGLLPGFADDVALYKSWALGVARDGVATAYEKTNVDYPPLFLYMLWAVGEVERRVDPAATATAPPESPLFTLLIKTPHLVFDLALAFLLMELVGRFRLWGARRDGPACGRLAALLYLWNPAVLFGSAYWGQPDGVHSFLALAALAALSGGLWFGAGLLLAMAGLMKPLAAPLLPLLILVAWLRGRWSGLMRAGIGGLVGLLVTFLPFLLTGRLLAVVQRVLFDLDAMPFTSANAHNLWWILGAWEPANGPLLGPLTPKWIGLTLFAAGFVLLAARSGSWWTRSDPDRERDTALLLQAGAALCAAFYFVMTHMHENHLFLVLPLLLAVAGRSRLLAWLVVACSLAIAANEMLHDPELPHRLPGFLSRPSGVIDPYYHRPYTWLQLAGSYANTILVAALTAGTWVAAWRATGKAADYP